MAGKYLDDSGLSKLWAKIKASFLPMKEISQNDYDNLSSDKKNANIIYIIKK